MISRLNLIVITLWVGALWMNGITAYMLFDVMHDKQLAGGLAGKLFTLVSYWHGERILFAYSTFI